MPLNKLMNDRVTLIKKNGDWFDNIPATVQSGMIVTTNPMIPIEDGDRFERRLPSGIVESFLIVDAGFHSKFHKIPAHYQSKVHKETALISSGGGSAKVVYNLIGPNTRVNIQSADSSTNVVNIESSTLFDEMKKAIVESIQDELTRSRLVERIDAMKSAAGTQSFISRYTEFIAIAADHMTLLAPFLPALSQLLLLCGLA